jgi:hypothetical protein
MQELLNAANTLQTLRIRIEQLKTDKQYKQDQIQQINLDLVSLRAQASTATQAVKDAASALVDNL